MKVRRQSGSVLVLGAAMMMIMIAFLGLVIDGGEISSAGRAAQNAADGAALGAAYDVLNNGQQAGYTIPTSPNKVASTVAANNGIPTTDITMSYLDSTGTATTTPANVAYVKADVSHNFPTLFLPVIGIDSAALTAHAKVALQVQPPLCGICVLGSGANALRQTGATVTEYLAPIVVNSQATPAMSINGPGNVADSQLFGFGPSPAIYVGTGGTWTSAGGGTYSPVPTNSASIADPFAAITLPSSGSPPRTNQGDLVISDSANHTANPGIYGKLEFTGSGKLTLNPGTYIIKTDVIFNGLGKVDGSSGVTIYLACSTYPTACTAGGQAGATFLWTGATQVSLAGAAAGGEFPGMLLMTDRNNTSGLTISPTGASGFIGSVYAAASGLSFAGSGFACYCQLVVNTISFNLTSGGTFFWYASQNYQPTDKLVLQT